jgi:hypothetical protein
MPAPIHPRLRRPTAAFSRIYATGVGMVVCLLGAQLGHAATPRGPKALPPAGVVMPVDEPRKVVEPPVVVVRTPAQSVRSLIRKGKFVEALAEIDKLLAVSPHDDEVRVQRARLLYWLNRRAEAETELRGLRARHPADLDVLELLARVRLASGDSRGALEVYLQMEAVGGVSPQIHQRIVDLLVEAGESAKARQALALGGVLSDEQELRLARQERPWTADLGSSLTLHKGQYWPRVEAMAGRRLTSALTLAGGAVYERRDVAEAVSGKLEAYLSFWRVDAMAHLSGSASGTFLPRVDARVDGAVGVWRQKLSLGLYGRFAHYQYANLLSGGPYLQANWRRWTLTPGFFLNETSYANLPSRLDPTGYLKLRWEQSARTAWILWGYWGRDQTFVERFGATETGEAVSAVLGVDHWWTGRWGTRATVSTARPMAGGEPYSELSVVLRGRL